MRTLNTLVPSAKSLALLEHFCSEMNSFSHWLKTVNRRVQHQNHLPVGGRGILQTLDRHGSLTVPHIARTRAVSRQNVQTFINKLVTLGLVELVDNPNHRRSNLVRLSESGKSMLETASRKEAQVLAKHLPEAAESDLQVAISVLRKIHSRLAERIMPLREVQLDDSKPQRLRRKARRKQTAIKVGSLGATSLPSIWQSTDEFEDEIPIAML